MRTRKEMGRDTNLCRAAGAASALCAAGVRDRAASGLRWPKELGAFIHVMKPSPQVPSFCRSPSPGLSEPLRLLSLDTDLLAWRSSLVRGIR